MLKNRQGRPNRPAGKRRIRRRGGARPIVSFILIIAAVVLAMSVFFKVSKITVKGNSYYTADQVIEASGIEEGDNLFFVNRFSAVSKIFAKLPYIQKATVTRGLPNRVTITVTESQTHGLYPAGERYVDHRQQLQDTGQDRRHRRGHADKNRRHRAFQAHNGPDLPPPPARTPPRSPTLRISWIRYRAGHAGQGDVHRHVHHRQTPASTIWAVLP
jgi:hypothetical protein